MLPRRSLHFFNGVFSHFLSEVFASLNFRNCVYYKPIDHGEILQAYLVN